MWLVPLLLFVTTPLWKPGLASFLTPRGGYQAKPVVNPEDVPAQSFVMDTITITMSNKGRVEWVINAERAFTARSDKEIGMIDVDARYTDKSNEQTLITSSQGMYDVNKRHLLLMDNVIIRKPAENQEIFTDLLHYFDETKLAVSPGDVEIRGLNYTIEAGRLEYNLATNTYDFTNRVKVDI